MCGPKFCSMKISQDIPRDAKLTHESGAETVKDANPTNTANAALTSAEAEAGMAEMSAKFRAGGGAIEVKV